MTSKKPASRKKAADKKVDGKRKITYVALVIDRSGSMDSVRKQALNGLNEQIQTLRNNAELGGETYVTLIQFNDKVEVVFDKKPAAELQDLTMDDYRPTGGTAMYDAVFTATERIAATREEMKSTDDIGHLVVVISDGEENSSKIMDGNRISQVSTRLQNTGKWTFTYMLSNVDLTKVRSTVNAYQGNVTWYNSNATGTAAGFTTTSNATTNYMTLRSSGVTNTNCFYSSTTPLNVNGGITLTPANTTTGGNGTITLSNNGGTTATLTINDAGNLILNGNKKLPEQK